eukprot:TRINITY_DN7435_c0_g1_i1.p1 TRINITY_DN7435_c0_g1~~TRINITY_DN7435_c0_g1_i1.p1  ORF type:complete len:789 (+),score=137.76 TRINITY_DN7435_c0_g1_i1:53-2368(+)
MQALLVLLAQLLRQALAWGLEATTGLVGHQPRGQAFLQREAAGSTQAPQVQLLPGQAPPVGYQAAGSLQAPQVQALPGQGPPVGYQAAGSVQAPQVQMLPGQAPPVGYQAPQVQMVLPGQAPPVGYQAVGGAGGPQVQMVLPVQAPPAGLQSAGSAQMPFPQQAPPAGIPLYPVDTSGFSAAASPSDGITILSDDDSPNLRVLHRVDPARGIAWGFLRDTLDTNGWISLILETTESSRVTNDIKMYTAGFVEGLLTAPRISQFYSNFYNIAIAVDGGPAILENIKGLMKSELTYLQKKSNFHGGLTEMTAPADPYWANARHILFQLYGMRDGYNVRAAQAGQPALTMIDIFLINSHGQLPELMEAYSPGAIDGRVMSKRVSGGHVLGLLQRNMTESVIKADTEVPDAASEANASTSFDADRDWERRLSKRGRCSAFVRVTENNEDLLVGHTTWSDYSKMTRLFKYYHFKLPGLGSRTNVIGFSSYPGCVSSTDDFYMLDSGLVVMDTSIEVLNPRVYDYVKDQVPGFVHVMIVNRLSRTAPHWSALMSSRTTGTASAQWLVVDYNLFTRGENIRENTIWMVDMVPGHVHREDVSHTLSRVGYVASYNRPYFPEIRRITGHTAAEKKYGALYSYENGPRASIFKRVGPNVKDLFGMRITMNRNEFPKEGILPSGAGHAISARMDENQGGERIPNGGIDAKVVNWCLFKMLQCQAISGPSHDHQPVFRWTAEQGGGDLWPGWPHLGLPDSWNFDWVQMSPTALLPAVVDVPTC